MNKLPISVNVVKKCTVMYPRHYASASFARGAG